MLGTKLIHGIHNVAHLGHKVLNGGLALGDKVRTVVSSAPVQWAIDKLPSPVKPIVQTGLTVGNGLLNAGHALSNKLTSIDPYLHRGAEILNKVKSKPSIELSRPQASSSLREMPKR
jgi:hypothetical protein